MVCTPMVKTDRQYMLSQLSRSLLSVIISIKWLYDRLTLPLIKDHLELYRIIHRLCWEELGKFPDLINCRDYNDKIQWLKLFDQSRETVICSDKIKSREFIDKRVGNKYLPSVYQVHDHYCQIDFSTLPKIFVIKTNHDSGGVFPVQDKHQIDHEQLGAAVERALSTAYGWESGEWAYSYVCPKVFVEEFLAGDEGHSPPDYKFHCSDGKVLWLQFIRDRATEVKEVIVLPEGQVTSIHFDRNMSHDEKFTLPTNWEEMKRVAGDLSRGFKYVRVDLYLSRGHIYVGELTFFPLKGCYRGEGQRVLGRLVDFERDTVKPFLLPSLESECSRRNIYRKL